MFGLFSKKTYQPTVTPEDKDWVEKNIIWFIEVFGLDKLKEQPFISPTTENFPYNNLKDTEQFQKLFEQLCKYWDLNPNEIIVKFFDDIKSKQWKTWMPHGKFNEPGELYNSNYRQYRQKVADVVNNQFYEMGKHNIDFNSKDLPAGLYFYTISTNEGINALKLVLSK